MANRILLAEDNEDNRDMLARRLRKRNFEVLFAENGQKAIDLAGSESPDLILMDISMPIKSGLEAIEEIRGFADETIATTPIIALTAHAMESDRELSLAAGADDFETKPINFGELLEKISALCGSKDL